MKSFLLLFAFSSSFSFAQEYFQQEVHYKIDVTLDDVNNTLQAYEEFEYINNSPNTLDFIYIHAWANAYKDGTSALAQQQYRDGDEQMQHLSEKDRGYIDSFDFKINGTQAKWEYHDHHEDIIQLKLNSPLQPGGKITVSTPFFVKIPSGSISRLGHVGQSFQITQWYPKPAVYDVDGWHQMPYLGQGEFYSEYGSFDVSITLPENYVVGATGDLQTQSEIDFLNKIADETAKAVENGLGYREIEGIENLIDFPASSEKMKTIRYTQKNVHDFAWFADKRYSVLKSEVELPHSKRKVTTWAMYTPKNARTKWTELWTNASEYLNDAIYYYSLWNGDYPYNQVTAVDGTISAGGGMEYPNVTVIGNSSNAHELEVVIVHEVGHNWFYGQLGSNERVHGWMDEGMNTLNEIRYMQTKYPNNSFMSDMVLNGIFHLNDLSHHDMADQSYRGIAGLGEDQPIETHSNDFTSINYGVIMYQKTGLVFYYLKDYLGEELFDKAMKAYYAEWEFKHPQPIDMQKSLEKTTGKDLSWAFVDLIQTTNHVDYKIKNVKKTKHGYAVKVKNVGQVDGPIEINAIKNDSVVETVWVEPGLKKNVAELSSYEVDKIVIDHNRDIPEMYRQNNEWKVKGLLHKYEKVKVEYLFGDNEENSTNVFWTPYIAGNDYDKFMLGIALHNYSIPTSRFNYFIAPSYSFGRNFVSGVSEFSYNFLPKSLLKTSRFGASIKSFKNDSQYERNDSYFISVAPYWIAKIGNRGNRKPITQYIKLQSIYKKDKVGPTHIEHVGAYIEYVYDYVKTDHRINLKLRNEYMTNVNSTDEMARIMIETTYKYRYAKKAKSWVEIRLFGGQQYIRNFSSANAHQYSMSLTGRDGRQDLFVDDYYFGRNRSSNIWSQQRANDMGGFKSATSYGESAIGMGTANLYFQFPFRKLRFIGIFADVGAFHDGVTIQTAYNTGLGIRLGSIFGIYFPVWMDDNTLNSFTTANYTERIRFSLKFNPFTQPINLKRLGL